MLIILLFFVLPVFSQQEQAVYLEQSSGRDVRSADGGHDVSGVQDVADASGCQSVVEYTLYPEQAASGGSCFDTTFSSCLATCDGSTSCTAFDWDSPDRCCVFENGSPGTLTSWAGVCTYIKMSCLDIPNEKYFSRSDWGASSTQCSMSAQSPNKLTIHHTAGAAKSTSSAGKIEVKSIQNYHQNTKGWCDIGYHFLVDLAGNIYQGRPFVSSNGWPQPGSPSPTFTIGAHTGGYNTNNIGISVMGNFGSNTNMTRGDAAYNAVVLLVANLAQSNGISIDSNTLRGHTDYSSTACPGQIYDIVPEFREEVTSKLQNNGGCTGSTYYVEYLTSPTYRSVFSPIPADIKFTASATGTKYYVFSASNPERNWMETNMSPEDDGWAFDFYFYASSTPQADLTRIYVQYAEGPWRIWISTSPPCCGWNEAFSFYAEV